MKNKKTVMMRIKPQYINTINKAQIKLQYLAQRRLSQADTCFYMAQMFLSLPDKQATKLIENVLDPKKLKKVKEVNRKEV